VLSDAEIADVTNIDIDEVMVRFENLNRGKYTTESLQSYRSRLRNSLSEFYDYCNDPLSFKPRRRLKLASAKRAAKPEVSSSAPTATIGTARASATARGVVADAPYKAPVQILPVALRSDLIVQIAGLPHDLTRGEAQKLANIILAHALDQ